MDFKIGFIIVILLFCGTYFSPEMQYFENFTNGWWKDSQGVLYGGRAWLGKNSRWAPATFNNKYMPL